MKNNNLSPMELYMNLVFKLLIVIIPSVALCAGITFTVLHLLNFYPDVKMSTMLIFDASCLLYTLTGLFFNRICEGEDGLIKPSMLKKGKIFIAIMEIVQWNFISYMIPSRDFWAYSFFFVLLAFSFLDSKFLLFVIFEIVVSMFVSWFVRPELMLSVTDAFFIPEMVLRIVLIILCFTTIYLISRAIERKLANELEKMSDIDTLTLLYNRRKLEKYFAGAVAQKEKNGELCVIMSDIDDFKIVNDTFGHSCGDEVLKDVATIMRSVVGSNGITFRFGGEEMLILAYAGEDGAYSIAEQIRTVIENHKTIYEDKSIGITMTFGVAEYSDADTLESLIKRADTNLYYGKSHGKNCVVK